MSKLIGFKPITQFLRVVLLKLYLLHVQLKVLDCKSISSMDNGYANRIFGFHEKLQNEKHSNSSMISLTVSIVSSGAFMQRWQTRLTTKPSELWSDQKCGLWKITSIFWLCLILTVSPLILKQGMRKSLLRLRNFTIFYLPTVISILFFVALLGG